MKVGFRPELAILLTLAVATFPRSSMAASLEEVIARLDQTIARLDKVEAENAALRARLRRPEATAPAQASVPKPKQVGSADFREANARVQTKAPVWGLPAPNSWNGVYIGANLNGVWGRESGIESILGNVRTGQTISGVTGGGQIGANLQYNHVVLGAEISADFGRVSGSSLVDGMGSALGGCAKDTTVALPLAGLAYKQFLCHAQQDWTVSFLPKIGYSFWDDSLLAYGKGGVSLSNLFFATETLNFVNGINNVPATVSGQASKMLVGATFGGGLEYRISSPLSIGVEYLYSMYGSQPLILTYFNVAPTQGNQQASSTTIAATSSHSLDTQVARVFLNYRFAE